MDAPLHVTWPFHDGGSSRRPGAEDNPWSVVWTESKTKDESRVNMYVVTCVVGEELTDFVALFLNVDILYRYQTSE